jgi:hypothetical protein
MSGEELKGTPAFEVLFRIGPGLLTKAMQQAAEKVVMETGQEPSLGEASAIIAAWVGEILRCNASTEKALDTALEHFANTVAAVATRPMLEKPKH